MSENELVFLSYAKEDAAAASHLYQELTTAGVRVWFDREELAPGANWKAEIRKAIRKSRYFIALISSTSMAKKGFVQTELREALEVLKEYPENEIYLIPTRLDSCETSYEVLSDLQWVDLFPDWESGRDQLLRLFGATDRNSATESIVDVTKREGIFAPTVRLDGIYQSKKKNEFDSCIRFYEDGLVIRTSTTGTPDQIVKWFNRAWADDKAHTQGRYIVSGANIQFSTKSAAGIVDLKGTIQGDTLILKSHSHINGYRTIREYQFVRVDEQGQTES